jgi:HPt (histidine-containing phosphotransfer) domain-containing protein
MTAQMLLATVSGSFHRHMSAIADAVGNLTDLGVHVLSPADPRIVAAHHDFYFVASDRTRSVRLVQDRHLESIAASAFLWLVNPDGYVGQSASMEIGYAVARGVGVYSMSAPSDLTLQQYVKRVPDYRAAITDALTAQQRRPRPGFLIDPHASISEAHDILGKMQSLLQHPPSQINDGAAALLIDQKLHLTDLFRESS